RAEVRGDGDTIPGSRVGTGEGPAAQLAVDRHRGRRHVRGLGRTLPVSQLAQVEVPPLTVEALHPDPAEEDVADRLHEPLPDDDPLAAVVELAGRGELLQHRRTGLLRL